MIATLSSALLPIFIIVAAAGDTMFRRIPNWLILMMLLCFFPMALATGMGWGEIGSHCLSGVILLVVGFVLNALGVFGGGDGKMLAMIGLWLGNDLILSFLLATGVAGGVVAIVIGLWSLTVTHWQAMDKKWAETAATKLRPSVPYGYALAVGALLVFPQSWWFAAQHIAAH